MVNKKPHGALSVNTLANGQVRKVLIRVATFAMGIIASGCIQAPTYYGEVDRGEFSPIVMVSSSVKPEITSNIGFKTTGGSALAGAGEGIGACAQAGGGGDWAGALFAVLCVPAGAVIGGIYGTSIAEQEKKQFQARNELVDKTIHGIHQDTFLGVIESYGQETGLEFRKYVVKKSSLEMLKDTVLQRYSENDRYPVLLTGIENIDIQRINNRGKTIDETEVCVDLKVFVKLYRQKKTVYRVSVARVGCRMLSEWTGDAGKKLLEDLKRASKKKAQSIVDDYFLVYYPPARSASSSANNTQLPGFTVTVDHPAPPRRYKKDIPVQTGEATIALANYTGRRFIVPVIDRTTPGFSWQPYNPEGLKDSSDSSPNDARYEIVVYEGNLNQGVYDSGIIFKKKKNYRYWSPGNIIYRRKNLVTTEHIAEEPLNSCKVYFWTIRAHFTLGGWPRTTKWANPQIYNSQFYPFLIGHEEKTSSCEDAEVPDTQTKGSTES